MIRVITTQSGGPEFGPSTYVTSYPSEEGTAQRRAEAGGSQGGLASGLFEKMLAPGSGGEELASKKWSEVEMEHI